MIKKIAMINYKSMLSIPYSRGKKKEKFVGDLLLLLYGQHPYHQKRFNWDESNTSVKSCTTIMTKVAYIIRTITQKPNQRKYNKVSISCLYLIH